MFDNLVRNVSHFVSKNAPAILTGIGVSGVLTTTVLAVRATPAAVRDIQEAESERVEPLTNLEKVQLTWLYYVPAGIAGCVTIVSIIGAQSLNAKRQSALLSIYALSEKALTEFKTKTEEIVGEKKTKQIKDEIAKDHLTGVPMVNSEVYITGRGEHLCFDSLSSRYFKGDIESIRKAVNDINQQCINDMSASVNDFYDMIGLPHTALGDEMGWSTDNFLEIEYSSHLSEVGEPCISLEYHGRPDSKFGKIW